MPSLTGHRPAARTLALALGFASALAAAPGARAQDAFLGIEDARETTLTVLQPDGSPAAGLRLHVRAFLDAEGRTHHEVAGDTGADGRVTLRRPDGEHVRVVAFLDDAHGDRWVLDLGNPPARAAAFPLPTRLAIGGQVVATDGTPLAGAEVRWTWGTDADLAGEARLQGRSGSLRTGDEGQWRLDHVPAGALDDLRLQFRADGWATAYARGAQEQQTLPLFALRSVLDRGTTVRLAVTGADGAPSRGATVGYAIAAGEFEVLGRTDGEGRATLAHVPAAATGVFARDRRSGATARADLPPPPRPSRTDLALTIRPRRTG